jgi:hypothetical protein
VQQKPREVLDPVVSVIGSASQGCTVDIVLSMDDFSLQQILKEKIMIMDAPVTGQHQQQGETSTDLVESFVGKFGVRELVQQEPLEVLDPVVPAISSTSHVCDVNIVTSVDDFPLERNLGGDIVIAKSTVTGQQLQPEETVRGMVDRFEQLSRCTSRVLPAPTRHRQNEDVTLADQMRMQIESLWSEVFRLRENDMRLTRENENLHELLDSHNRKAGCLDDGDFDDARAADAVCDDLDDSGIDDGDIGDHVPARPLALAGCDGVPDADSGVSDGEHRPLPVSIMDHHDSALHALRAEIRAEY